MHTDAFFQMSNAERGKTFWPEIDFLKSGISQTEIMGGGKLSVEKACLKFVEGRKGTNDYSLFICSCSPVVSMCFFKTFIDIFSHSEIQHIPARFDSNKEEFQLIQLLSIVECWRNYPFVGIEPDPFPGFTKVAVFEPAAAGNDIFRIAGYQAMIVVSRRAKKAILDSGIRSVEFDPLLSLESDNDNLLRRH